MRIARLHLQAFGPFRNARLDFDTQPEALQVIYGGNEAGKSTTLRAIIQLLYGIPHRTADAHLHEQSKLRIGATLVGPGGQRLQVVRRKGKGQTLLDGQGEPLEESRLTALLGGTSEALFRSMFGLDHEQLRAGAEALLAGRGDLGEGLFDAGVGGAPVHRVLAQLKAEAEQIYKKRGSTPLLNGAIRRAKELAKSRREAALAPEKWQAQRDALERAQKQHATLSERRESLQAEDRLLKMALGVLPKLAKLSTRSGEREALGDAPHLDPDATQRRLDAEQLRSASARELTRLRERRARLQEELDALPQTTNAHGGEAKLGERVVRRLREAFGSYRKAEEDLPVRRGELSAAQANIDNLRAQLPKGAVGRDDDEYRVPASTAARITELAETQRRLREERARLEGELEERAGEVQEQKLLLYSLGQARALGPLETMLGDARAQGDVAGSLHEREAEVLALKARLSREIKELGLPGSPAELVGLVLPVDVRVGQSVDARRELDAQREELELGEQRVDQERADLRAARKALRAAGEVPSEEAVRKAREARDASFEALRGALTAKRAAAPAEVEHFAEHVAHTDGLADRLWREADRVRQQAELDARQERAEQSARELHARREAWQARDLAWRQEFAALCTPLGLPEMPVREAARRIERARALQPEAERYLALSSAWHARRDEADAFARELQSALQACDPAWGDAQLPLSQLGRGLERARELLREEREKRVRAEGIAQRQQRAERDRNAIAQRLTALAAEAERHETQWADAAAALGLSEGASAEERMACLRVLSELDQARNATSALRGRVSGMQRDMTAHEAQVRAMCAEHLDGFEPASAAEGVDRLEARYEALRDANRDRARLEESLRELSPRETQARLDHEGSEQALRQLCERAGVEVPEALHEAEQRAQAATRLDRELRELREELLELGEGQSLEVLREQVAELTPEQARRRRAQLEEELEGVVDELDAAKQEIGRTQAGLELYETSAGAADLAEQHESQLSEVAELSRSYLVHHLAEQILRGEVERYREANQGPVLKRASALVGPLTLGRYTGLKLDFVEGETPTLRMTRTDGQEVGVDGLSDGTRDQLYLALRLSSLERFVEHNPPLPLVLDDCFVHFDDARTSAALKVLGQYTAHTQVLLFTHHARLVELAEAALGARGVCVHDLEHARSLGEGRNDGPLFGADRV